MNKTLAPIPSVLADRDLELLAVIARLPLISASQLARILGDQPLLYRRLEYARRRGLIATAGRQPRVVGRPAQLLRVTQRGHRLLAEHAPHNGAVRTRPRAGRGVSPHQLATLLACYELLSDLAQAGGGSASVTVWEQPWHRAYRPAPGRGLRHLSLPAAATLTWSPPDEVRSRSYLLLPDLGGMDLRAWRPRLLDLARLQQAYQERLPALAIVTTSEARARAWRRALAEAAAKHRDWPLEGWTISIASHQAGLAVLKQSTREHRERGTRCLDAPLGVSDLEVLDAVGRHPFLTTALLATLLGREHRSVQPRLRRLVEHHLVRVVPPAELRHPDVESERTLELTCNSLVAVAASLGLPPATAVRLHALTGGGPCAAFGPRQMLLAHAAHTRAADRVMVGLAAVARTDPRGACLVEWRNAAACAHGRLQPDGYGLLRLAGHECGFFLELDRATMRPAELRAKFVAYHRFRASRRAALLYTSFPTVLVITTGPGAEHRLANAVRAVDASFASPLPVLLTTTAWIDAHARGMLGPIWRQPHAAARLCWPRLKQDKVPHAY